MKTRSILSGTSPTVLRWFARIVSVGVIIFWGFFALLHMIGGEQSSGQPLSTEDVLLFVLMGSWLAGLAIAWKWERVGGFIVVIAYGLSIVINPMMLSFPFLLIPLAGLSFVLASLLEPRRVYDTESDRDNDT